MLLRHALDAEHEASAIEAAIGAALESGYRTADMASTGQDSCSCSGMTDAIIERI